MEFGRTGKSKRAHPIPQEKNIQVVVRCRPRSVAERRSGSQSVVQCNSKKGELLVKQEVGDKTTTKTFTFDKVYGPESRQIDVYRGVVEPLIEEVLMGYNCTVFAYGQTGTGKTYTMEGERSLNGSLSWEEDPLAGVVPRSLHELFEKIEAQNVSEFSIRVSFLELYNEELFDLLSPGEDSGTRLRIFEDSARKGSVVIHGLEELQVHSKDEVYAILDQGRAKRRTAATLLNAQSSRSHSVFSVTVHIKENSIEGEELLKTGKLNLVDLAGSENISRSGAVDRRAREAGQINQSLLTLGRVITSLVERAPHVPYRESKLTRILQDSLGGRTKTSIIATVSPAVCNIEETLSTLDYAHRAKNITNRPEINQRLTKKALIKEYTDEIEKLKKDLLATRDKNGIYISPENYAGMEALIRSQRGNIAEFEAHIAANKDEIAKLNEMFATSKAELEQTTQRLETTSQRLVATKENLVTTRRDLYQTSVEGEQKSLLLQEHSNTEQTLLSQAGQLMEVVEGAIGDVDGLHSKLERKTRVETSNSAAAQAFQTSVEGEFKRMQQRLEEFHTTQTHFCHNLSQRIEQWSSEQRGCVQCLCEGVEGVTSLLSQFSDRQTSVGRERTSDLQHTVSQSQTNTTQFQASLVSMADSLLTATLQPLLTRLSDQLALQSSLLSQSTASLKTQLQSHGEFVTQFVSEQNQKIEQLSSAVQRENLHQQTMMSAHQDAITTALENQRTLSEQLRLSMMAEMEILVQRTMRHQQEQLGASMALVSMGMKRTAESQQSHTDLLHREFSGMTDSLSGLAVATDRETSSTTTSIDSMVTQHEKATEEQEVSVQGVGAEVKNGLNALKQMTKSHAKDHWAELQTISTALTTHKQQAESEIEAHVSAVQQSCSTLHSSLNSLATSGVSQPACQWRGDAATLSSAVAEFADSQGAGIAAAGNTVSHYVSQELAVDVPTGKTPQRRDFSYPQHLSQTRPHTDLLRNFHPTITLPPLPESDTEEEEVEDEQSTVSVALPSFDLSQESSEVESFETTTTSVDSSMSSRTDMVVDRECKENTRLTPAFSKLSTRKKYMSGSKSIGTKKRPLTVKN